MGTIDFTKEQHLGTTALVFSMFQISLPVIAALVISLFLLIMKSTILAQFTALMSLAKVSPATVSTGLTYVNLGFVGIMFFVAGLLALIAWLDYINYTFRLDTFALIIKRGILDREEISIPYRQIQDVNINRPLLYRFFGTSKLVMMTAGHDEGATDRSEGVLDMLDKVMAEQLHQELLRRGAIQMVSNVDSKKV